MKDSIFQEVNQQSISPMMRQYLAIKSVNQEHFLFYRMGDFYELFFEDAVIAAPILEITLTKRGNHEGDSIPMCGVPAHALEIYLQKLIKFGRSIAICEQLETPQEAKKRSYKAIVKREVVRIITPGTILEESLLKHKANNYLLSIAAIKKELAVAWLELSTGNFYVTSVNIETLPSMLSMLSPKEIIIDEELLKQDNIKNNLNICSVTPRSHSLFDLLRTSNRLEVFYRIDSLDGFAKFTPQEISAAGSLLEYVEYTQKSSVSFLKPLKQLNHTNFLLLDPVTKKHLEIEVGFNNDNKTSLLHTIDRTITSSGGRLLCQYIAAPLLDVNSINKRLDAVDVFFRNPLLGERLRDIIKSFPDVERAFSRIYSKRANYKDLVYIRQGINVFIKIAELLRYNEDKLNDDIKADILQIGNFDDLINELKEAINLQPVEGDYIKNGYSHQLDRLRQFKNNTNAKIDDLREQYRVETGVNNLKIQRNNVIGYFVEVSSIHSSKLQTAKFMHRQALGSVVRYLTEDLKQLEAELLVCDEKIAQLILELLDNLCTKIIKEGENIIIAVDIIAKLDVASAFAVLALENNYIKPVVSDTSDFIIKGGRHPVVEKLLVNNTFTSNDCELTDKSNFHLITGPNMAGKSTFLRQNALIAIMAQSGSFVPAQEARIGIIEKIFSRIGSGDNIAGGQSTFMVEMLETAYILNNSNANSLIILDEIGRGTSTYDGLSIAWSVIEYLHNNIKAKVLFSTHYHELTDLEKVLHRLTCYHMLAQEWEGRAVFLHKIAKGRALKSYGINVAEMAGVPKIITDRAHQILNELQDK